MFGARKESFRSEGCRVALLTVLVLSLVTGFEISAARAQDTSALED